MWYVHALAWLSSGRNRAWQPLFWHRYVPSSYLVTLGLALVPVALAKDFAPVGASLPSFWL